MRYSTAHDRTTRLSRDGDGLRQPSIRGGVGVVDPEVILNVL